MTDFEAVEKKDADVEIVNKQELMGRVFGKKALLEKVVGIFSTNRVEMMLLIQQAIVDKDSEALERAAHTAKGVLANLAAPIATKLAAELELMGKGGDLSNAQQCCDELKKEALRAQKALGVFVRSV